MILGLRSWGIGVALGAVACIGCKVEPSGTSSFTQHCSELQGDATCSSTFSNRPFCSSCNESNQGCVLVRPPVACTPGGTGDPPIPDDSTTSDGGDSSSGTTTTGLDTSGDAESTGEPPCLEEGELDPSCMALDSARPYCFNEVCVGCQGAGGNQFCSELDPAAPGCDTEGGSCVLCTELEDNPCFDANPVCGEAGECQACSEHDQCASGACHKADDDPLYGYCFAEDEVIYIDNSATCPGLGTEAEPACSLFGISDTLVPGDTRVLRIAGGSSYNERATFLGKITLAIIGDGTTEITGAPGQNAATFRFDAGVRAYIADVNLNGNVFSHGVQCSNSIVDIEDSNIIGNDGWGLFDFDPCEVSLDRVIIASNEDGGVRLDGGQLSIVNSGIAVNGVGGSSTGVRVDDASVDILYSTIVGNNGSGSDSIECNNATGTLRNSIVAGVDDTSIELDCFPLLMDYNALDAANFAGGTNVEIGAYEPIQFNGPAEGDLTLAAPPLSPFGGVALWQEGDPLLDADGTPRPVDEMMGFAGIDEP